VSRRLLPILLVLAAAIAYPVAIVSGGAPHFPERSDCVDLATKDGEIDAVFGASTNVPTRWRGFGSYSGGGSPARRLKVTAVAG
jgi:hypothetical protein